MQRGRASYRRMSAVGGPLARFWWNDAAADSGGNELRGGERAWPCQKPPWGRLVAVNAATGDIAWQVPLGITEQLPEAKQRTGRLNIGGPITTAGGLAVHRRDQRSADSARSTRARATSCGRRALRAERARRADHVSRRATASSTWRSSRPAPRRSTIPIRPTPRRSSIAYAIAAVTRVVTSAVPRTTQVAGIIGAGPSGLLLSQLLHLAGVESVVLERRSRELRARPHSRGRARAGARPRSYGARASASGWIAKDSCHHGVELCFGERGIASTSRRSRASVTVYGQTEITKDLMEARDALGGTLIYEADGRRDRRRRRRTRRACAGARARAARARVRLRRGLRRLPRREPEGDPGRPSSRTHERVYPFGWLGVLADVPPVSHELLYASHERGFALCSMRSATRSRCYVQCALDDDLAAVERRAVLGRAAFAAARGGGAAPRNRPVDREEHRAAAQLRRGAAALRSPVPRGRRRAHRAADRREGLESRGPRRRSARDRADRALSRAAATSC